MTIAALKMITLDSSDAQRDATFWSAVLGWEVAHAQDEYAMLTGPGGLALGFGTVEGHEAPGWPNEHGTKQFHLDLAATAQSARLTREEMALQAELGPVLWLAHSQEGSLEQAAARHRAIADAVRDGVSEVARAEAEAHVGELFSAVRRMVVQARRSG